MIVDDLTDEQLRDDYGLDELAVKNLRALPRRGARGDRRRAADRPPDRGRALPRRAGRLAHLRAVAVRRARARAVGPGDRSEGARPARRRGAGDLERRRHRRCACPRPTRRRLAESVILDPDEVEELVVDQVGSSAVFAARFRENAARALLLPRRRPGSRTPLWQMRQRAADLLAVASQYGSFPILLETYRECLRDVFDLPALVVAHGRRPRPHGARGVGRHAAAVAVRQLARVRLRRRVHVRGRRAARRAPGPGAHARPAHAGRAGRVGGAARAPRRRARSQRSRPSCRRSTSAGGPSTSTPPTTCCAASATSRRPSCEPAAPDDFADALDRHAPRRGGAHRRRGPADRGRGRRPLPRRARRRRSRAACPTRSSSPSPTRCAQLVRRWARTHGPFLTREPADRFGLPLDRVDEVLEQLVEAGTLVRGEFRPDGTEREWCDAEVLRRLRQRSLAALRREVEPTQAEALARFLPRGRASARRRGSVDRVYEVVGQLQGVAIPASGLERDVLTARVRDYSPRLLDELLAAGEVLWVGAGPLGRDDGKVMLFLRDQAPLLAPRLLPAPAERPAVAEHERLRELLLAAGCVLLPRAARERRRRPRSTRSGIWCGRARSPTTPSPRCARCRRSGAPAARRRGGRPRLGSLTVLGPPKAQGRWSLLARELGDPGAVSPTEAATALAGVLLDRHGVLTREAARGEGVPGGFAAVYPVLRAMEESGRIRRGYFVAGLGGAQFALPGAVDRLRDVPRRRARRRSRRDRARGHRPRQPLRRGVELARATATGPRRRRPSPARGGRVRRAGRRARVALRGEGRPRPRRPARARRHVGGAAVAALGDLVAGRPLHAALARALPTRARAPPAAPPTSSPRPRAWSAMPDPAA